MPPEGRSRAADADRLLAKARAENIPLAGLPEELTPLDAEDAYRIQDARWRTGRPWGWKVGPGEAAGLIRCSPLLGDGVTASPAEFTPQQVERLGIEVELAFTLGQDLPAGDVSDGSIRQALRSAHLAFELFRSRFVDRSKVPYPAMLADHLNNDGIVLGRPCGLESLPDPAALAIRLAADGVAVTSTESGAGWDEVMRLLRFLAQHAEARFGPLRAGDVVLTGARIGPLPIGGTRRLVAENAALGAVELHVSQ